MTDHTGFMEIDGIRLEYAWVGPDADQSPTIVLLHEGLGSVSTWKDFPARLSEATGCGVLVYSRRGYGRSDAVPLPRPLDYMQRHALYVLPKIIDHWDLQKVILVGHSDGASIAAVYAGGVEDKRVRGVVLIAPHFFNEQINVESIVEAKQDYETGDLKERLARHHGKNVDCAFYGWNRAWLDPGFMKWNIEDYLTYIRAPILLIWGARDKYGTLAQVHAAEETCYCPLDVLILDQSSHWPFREQPQETLDAISAFTHRLITVHGEKVGT